VLTVFLGIGRFLEPTLYVHDVFDEQINWSRGATKRQGWRSTLSGGGLSYLNRANLAAAFCNLH
jgi:hypothetical protein